MLWAKNGLSENGPENGIVTVRVVSHPEVGESRLKDGGLAIQVTEQMAIGCPVASV